MRLFLFSILSALTVSTVAAADVGLADASTDSGEADASDASVTSTDAGAEAGDAGTDAATQKDASPQQDASGACCPSLPCTCPADASSPEGGDEGGTVQSGGCSCDSSPAASASPMLLFALAFLARRKRS
jgi:MYXO-CTERM domain-containing protein